jgi:hypothetical protein
VLESPALVAVAVALAVIVYGGLLVVSWERSARPQPGPAGARNEARAPVRPPVRSAEPVEIPGGGVRFEHAVVRESPPTSPPVAVVAAPPAAAASPAARPPVVTPLESARGAVAEDAPLELEAAVAVASPAPPAEVAREPAAAAESLAARAAAGAIDPVAADRGAIGRVLGQYRESYNALDAASASTIWKGLDTKALERAFATLRSQELSFDRCYVALTSADHATARCRGVLNYVPKIGDGNPQQRRLSWTIDFQRAADRWLIAGVSAR